MKRFNLLLVASLCGSVSYAQEDGPYTFDFGPFAITFPEGDPGNCGETGFKDMGNQVFLYASNYDNGNLYVNRIDHEYDGRFEIKLHEPFDSVIVYDRYVNSYGMRVSETEGVDAFDTTCSDLALDDLFYYSAWQRIYPTGNLTYSFEKYGRGKDYWKPHKSGIDKAAFQKWYDEKMIDFPFKESDRTEVFSYQRQLKIEFYKAGEKSTYTIKFFHRDGEC